MTAYIFQILARPALGVAILVFGFAPGAVLRMIVLLYRRDHPRRRELLGELCAVPMVERPFWVAQQLEVALFEGLPNRFAARRQRPAKAMGYALGAALVALLVALDAAPLNLAAQAFGLSGPGTWLMTSILVAVSVGAMTGLELTRTDTRVRRILLGVIAVGYLALLGLRAEFLVTVAGEAIPVALLQSGLLTAISAGLVWCGAAVLARILPRLTAQGYRRRRSARVVGHALGAALVVLLVALDAFPLNWAAQAFGLNGPGTWLVTLILVVVSVGAMTGLGLTRTDTRPQRMLVGVVAVGYLALLGLSAEFWVTATGEPIPVALLQSGLLTAISAGLVWCGAAVLARILPRLTAQGNRR